MTSPLWLVFVGRIIYQLLKVCPFHYTAFAVSGKFLDPVIRYINIIQADVATQTNCPKSIRSRCVVGDF